MTPALAEYLRHELRTVRAPLSDEYLPTARAPMCHTPYMATLDSPPEDLMTGDTRPAPFGHTRDGDEVLVRRSGFAVDIDSDAGQLDSDTSRLMELVPTPRLKSAPSAPAPRRLTPIERTDRFATLTVVSIVAIAVWWHVIATLLRG